MSKHTSKSALLIFGSNNPAARRRTLGDGDEAIYVRLEQLGYQVLSRTVDEAAAEDLDRYTLIYVSSLVSNSTGPNNLTAKLQSTCRPVVVADEKVLIELMMSCDGGQFQDYIGQETVRIEIAANGHSLAAGMIDDADVLRRVGAGPSDRLRVMWATPKPSAVKVAALPRGGPDELRRRFVLFGYERGARLGACGGRNEQETVAAARRVACLFNDETAPHLTEDGWALFDATVGWAVGEELKQFQEVFREEWQEVRERRKRQGIYKAPDPDAPPGESWEGKCSWYDYPPDNLVGLALSGGGIRSATFCLGLLQGFSRVGMLRLFDYVSTVSGGGYLGGWWSAWLARGGRSRTQGQPPYPFFNVTDLKMLDEFVRRLRQDDPSLHSSKRALYGYLRQVFNRDTLGKLSAYDQRGGNVEEVKQWIVAELNVLTAHGGPAPPGCAWKPGMPHDASCPREPLYDPESADSLRRQLTAAFADISSEARDFAGRVWRGEDRRDRAEDVARLNRRLLEEVLREELGVNLFPGDERIEPVRSADYFKDTARRGRRNGAGGHETHDAAAEMQRLIEERKYKEENAESAKELLCSGQDPIHHLRLFSNYLTPRKGFLSADTWRAAAAITRNLALTWLTLLPIIFAAVLAGQLYFSLRPTAQIDAAVVSEVEAATGRSPVRHDFILPYRETISLRQRELREAEAELQRAREVTNQLNIFAASSREAGLQESVVNLSKRVGTLRAGHREALARRFWFALWPVGLLLAWIVVLTGIWMTPSIGGMKKRNIFCTFAVVALALLAAGAVWPETWGWMLRPRATEGAAAYAGGLATRHWLWLILFLAGTAAIFGWLAWLWKTTAAQAAAAGRDPATALNWSRSVVGTGTIRVHTLALALAAAAAFVLALAGFGHDLIDYLIYSEDGWWTTLGRWAAVLTAGFTLFASIFTAVKGTPKGGGEQSADDKPSLKSRLVFALTPPAVLLVLTFGVSWLSHWLLTAVARRPADTLGPLTLATLVGVALCLCFSVLETKWRRKAPIGWAWGWVLVSSAAAAAFVLSLPLLEVTGTDVAGTPVRWQWRGGAPGWMVERFYLLLPVIGALGLMLVRTFAKEINDGKHGRLFSFAPLGFLLGRRRSRPYLNRLELFALGLAVSALAAGVLYAIKSGLWSGSNLPRLQTPLLPDRMRVAMVAICLGGALLVWLLTLLELRRGTGNNRRALNVLLAALVTLSALLVISFVPRYEERTYALLGHASLALLATSLGWVVALGWLADPNMLSMHTFYKSRLVRAYLGASNPQRRLRPREITETVEGDDVLLSDLKNCQRGAPYHLINTTLNLAAGRDLTTAQRSSAMFVLSKHNCGSSRTGYRRTENYMGGHLSLGTAVAASGAAASPSMGSRTPPASLAMLMTILNVRLGFWTPTPNKEHWQQAQPQLWPFYLLREFLSQTNDLSSYSYLTDGGHFDNTGVYSLVERGCRFIVVADCGADPKPCFSDLGEAIRRCRIDFGAEIKLNFDPFVKNERRRATAHFIVGTVRYRAEHLKRLGWRDSDAEDYELQRGYIVVVKPALVDDEPPDVRQYGLENREFPQQSTADQWFDEGQFESYRRFGQECIERLFGRLSPTRPGPRPRGAAEALAPEADEIDIKKRAKENSPLTLDDIEEVFEEAYERFRPREMKPRRGGWLRKRLDEKLRAVLEEAREQGLEPTEGFKFYLERLLDAGVAMLQEIEGPSRYVGDFERNICELVQEVIERAKKEKTSRLHEHYFFVAREARHIFPFAEELEKGNGRR